MSESNTSQASVNTSEVKTPFFKKLGSSISNGAKATGSAIAQEAKTLGTGSVMIAHIGLAVGAAVFAGVVAGGVGKRLGDKTVDKLVPLPVNNAV